MFTATDLAPQVEREYAAALRRRFLWYAALSAPIVALMAIPWLLAVAGAGHLSRTSLVVLAVARLVKVAVFAIAFVFVWRNPVERLVLVRLVTGMIVLSGFLMMASLAFVVSREEGSSAGIGRDAWPLYAAILSMFVVHFVACLFLVLSPREAMTPLVPLLLCFAILALGFDEAPAALRWALVLLAPLAGLPGVLLSWARYSRLGDRFLGRAMRTQLEEMGQELSTARRIQEAIFPEPIREGPLRFDYAYEPMRAIGGDFVFLRRCGDSGVFVVLIGDVTGHGIPAALAVNRLVGDLEQATADTADGAAPAPDMLLTRLNRYLRTSLSREATFVTAFAATIDVAAKRLSWASAGHPPALLRRADGSIESLSANAVMLGVLEPSEFAAAPVEASFAPGDLLVLYTDGAFEAKDARGDQFGLDRVRASVEHAATRDAGAVARALLADVRSFRAGAAMDDVLVVEVRG